MEYTVDMLKAPDLSCSFRYLQTINSLDDYRKYHRNCPGDIVYDTSEESLYVYKGDDEWLILDRYNEPIETKEIITEVADMKCKNCGAPLIKYNKQFRTIKCDYCGSIFDIREIQR